MADPARDGRTGGLVAINLAAVLLGATALFARIDASPVWIVAARAAIAAAALACLALVLRAPLAIARRALAGAALTGALLGFHWVCFFASAKIGGVAIAALTAATFPLFTILLEAAVRGRRPSVVELASGGAIVVAVALLAGAPSGGGVLAGTVIGLIAAVSFAVFALASQTLVKPLGILRLSVWQYGFAVLALAPFLPSTEPIRSGADWLAVAALAIFGTALAHQLYLFALGRLPTSLCGAFVSLEPVYAIAMAALIFAEPLRPMVAVSAAIIVAASIALLRAAPPLQAGP